MLRCRSVSCKCPVWLSRVSKSAQGPRLNKVNIIFTTCHLKHGFYGECVVGYQWPLVQCGLCLPIMLMNLQLHPPSHDCPGNLVLTQVNQSYCHLWLPLCDSQFSIENLPISEKHFNRKTPESHPHCHCILVVKLSSPSEWISSVPP